MTHPHDDHIRGISQILSSFKNNIGFFGWWGGYDPYYQIAHIEELECIYGNKNKDIGLCSKSLKDIFDIIIDQNIYCYASSTAIDGDIPLFVS